MAALNGGVLPALATQIGHWECDVGTGDCSSSSSWVDFHWPVSSILEQAFCRGKSSVDFIRGGNQYQVVFDTDLPGRLKDASMDSPSTASQVNLKTKVKRTVRRFSSQAGKSQYLQREVERQSLSWSNWIGVSFTWLLEPPVVPNQEFPPWRSYILGDDAQPGPHFPEPLRSWPKVGTCAAHPKGDPCNFALERLMPDARCEQAAEWSILQQLWQNRGRRSRLLAAFRVQNRGLITSFVAQEQAMRKRLALGTDFVDGSPREASLGVELLWHGTRSQSSLLDICRDGFDRAHASRAATSPHLAPTRISLPVTFDCRGRTVGKMFEPCSLQRSLLGSAHGAPATCIPRRGSRTLFPGSATRTPAIGCRTPAST